MIRVLLVDDHTVVREGLRAVLDAHPQIQVVGDVSSGQEAARRGEELRPAVVIMDIWMPEVNGFEATHRLLKIDPQVKVVFLTMLGTPEHVQRALAAGACGYLLKESAGREVVEAVLAVAAGERFFSEAIMRTMGAYLEQPVSDAPQIRLDRLTRREREILELVVQGKSSAEIAVELQLSPKTVDSYRSRLMHKLGIADLPGLVRYAIQQGLLPLE